MIAVDTSSDILSIVNGVLGVGLLDRDRDRTATLLDGGVKDRLFGARGVVLLGGGLLDRDRLGAALPSILTPMNAQCGECVSLDEAIEGIQR